MPERGSSDGPDYGWLYGKKENRPPSGSEDPEPTQVMPKMRPADRRAASPTRPARATRGAPEGTALGALGVPGTPADHGDRAGRSAGARSSWLLLVAWLVYLVAVPLWAWSNIEKVDAAPAGARPAEQPGSTYLLVGSDSRKGLSAAENKRLGTGGVGDVGQRTDTIMLLHTGDGPSLLLSIPRDSLVDMPGHGTTKINAAFALGGPGLLVRTIEQNTGIRVDHYVEIGFGGFVNSVDAVGGITICPTQRMVDRRANLASRRAARRSDGVHGARLRPIAAHVSKYGDIDRARHQREVVSAIGSEVKSPWTFINPIRYFRVNKAATSSLAISKGTGPIALAKFGLGDDQGQRQRTGLTCGVPDRRPGGPLGPAARPAVAASCIKTDRTGDIPKRSVHPDRAPRCHRVSHHE